MSFRDRPLYAKHKNNLDTFEWLKNIHLHQDRLKKLRHSSLNSKGVRFQSIETKRAYVNSTRLQDSQYQRGRQQNQILKDNSKIEKVMNEISGRKLSLYGGLKIGNRNSGAKLSPFQMKNLLLNEHSNSDLDLDILKDVTLTAHQKNRLLQKLSRTSIIEQKQDIVDSQIASKMSVSEAPVEDVPVSEKSFSQKQINSGSNINFGTTLPLKEALEQNLNQNVSVLSDAKEKQQMSSTQQASGFQAARHGFTPINQGEMNKTLGQFPALTSNSFLESSTGPSRLLGQTARSIFHDRSHSLNMPVRKREEQRVLRENGKILLRVTEAGPSPGLQMAQMKAHFDQHSYLKKQIATKYLQRNEIEMKLALLNDASRVGENFPQVSKNRNQRQVITEQKDVSRYYKLLSSIPRTDLQNQNQQLLQTTDTKQPSHLATLLKTESNFASNEEIFKTIENEIDVNRRRYYGYAIGKNNTQYSQERLISNSTRTQDHNSERVSPQPSLNPYKTGQSHQPCQSKTKLKLKNVKSKINQKLKMNKQSSTNIEPKVIPKMKSVMSYKSNATKAKAKARIQPAETGLELEMEAGIEKVRGSEEQMNQTPKERENKQILKLPKTEAVQESHQELAKVDSTIFDKEQNAQDYFAKLEENESMEANQNSDGNSMFNQTGGRFINRTANPETQGASGVFVAAQASINRQSSSRYELYVESREKKVESSQLIITGNILEDAEASKSGSRVNENEEEPNHNFEEAEADEQPQPGFALLPDEQESKTDQQLQEDATQETPQATSPRNVTEQLDQTPSPPSPDQNSPERQAYVIKDEEDEDDNYEDDDDDYSDFDEEDEK